MVGGISDALAAGDIALAAEILWLSLKVIWQQGVAALNKAWADGKVDDRVAWQRVKPYEDVDTARVRALDQDDGAETRPGGPVR